MIFLCILSIVSLGLIFLDARETRQKLKKIEIQNQINLQKINTLEYLLNIENYQEKDRKPVKFNKF